MGNLTRIHFSVKMSETGTSLDLARDMDIPVVTTLRARLECRDCHYARQVSCAIDHAFEEPEARQWATRQLWEGIRDLMERHERESCGGIPYIPFADFQHPIRFTDELRGRAHKDIHLHTLFGALQHGQSLNDVVNATLLAYSEHIEKLEARVLEVLKNTPTRVILQTKPECVGETTSEEEAQAARPDRAEDPDGDRRPESGVPDDLQEGSTPHES